VHTTRLLAILATTCLVATVGLRSGDKLPEPNPANATNRFSITGMHCNGCAQGLTSELERARGVVSARVSFTNRLAVVAFDTNRTTTATLVKAIEEAGFKARKLRR
jgi:copper chaperone CopZ